MKEGWKIKGKTTVHCHTGSMRQKKVLKRDILTSHIAFEINTKLEMACLPLHLLHKSVIHTLLCTVPYFNAYHYNRHETGLLDGFIARHKLLTEKLIHLNP